MGDSLKHRVCAIYVRSDWKFHFWFILKGKLLYGTIRAESLHLTKPGTMHALCDNTLQVYTNYAVELRLTLDILYIYVSVVQFIKHYILWLTVNISKTKLLCNSKFTAGMSLSCLNEQSKFNKNLLSLPRRKIYYIHTVYYYIRVYKTDTECYTFSHGVFFRCNIFMCTTFGS